jgi:predicted phage terminase large subunit-like protein
VPVAHLTNDQGEAPVINDLIALARIDFGIFVALVFPVLHGGKQMVPASYVNLIVEVLMRSTCGGSRRLIFNLPPGYMKSTLITVLYTAWRLGVKPSEKIISISYGDDLSHELSRKTRQIMQSSIYQKIFPGTVLHKKAEDAITTTKGGHRYATAVGSDIAGFRADLIIMDDLIQPDAALNELQKQKLREWYYGVVAQRLRDQNTGVIVLVMHRLAPDDLTQTFVEEGGWYHIPMPLIAVQTEIYELRATGKTVHARAVGELLSPRWQSAETVERLRKTVPSHIFEAQFQQNPLYGGSGMCSVDRFVRYRERPPFLYTIHSWDVAATKNGNFTVCLKFGVTSDPDGMEILYLFQVLRIRVELPDVRTAIAEQDRLDKPALIVMDGNGVGLGIYQDLRKTMDHLVGNTKSMEGSGSPASKQQKFNDALPHLYDGLIRIPEHMPGLEPFLQELATFPDGKFDDQVDALSIIGAKRRRILQLARQSAERCGRWAPEERALRLRAAHEQPAPPRLKPHEQRRRLRLGLPLN